MSRPENRLQLMERLGAVQFNNRLAWCGVNEAEKKVYFSIWTDSVHTHNGEKGYIIQEPDWGINDGTGNKDAPRNDQDAKLSLVLEHGYEPYGYFIVAKDRTTYPREIAETRTSFVFRLRLDTLEDGSIFGVPNGRIEVT
jgi:hypothetical protein